MTAPQSQDCSSDSNQPGYTLSLGLIIADHIDIPSDMIRKVLGETDDVISAKNVVRDDYYTPQKAVYDYYLVGLYKINTKCSNKYLMYRSQSKRYISLNYPTKTIKFVNKKYKPQNVASI